MNAGPESEDAMNVPPRAYVEAMVIMIAADGKFTHEEKEHFRAALMTHPSTNRLSMHEIDEHINQAVQSLEREGTESRIRTLADEVTDPGDREALIHSVVLACIADGEVADEEMDVLEKMQEAFGMPDDRLKAIIGSVSSAG